MRPSYARQRGSALMTSLMMGAVLLAVVGGMLLLATTARRRAVNHARSLDRLNCLQSGIEIAKDYFGRNQVSWNSYLAAPTSYNPVAVPVFNPTPADPFNAALRTARPELFYDLDGDGQPDVYIYVRDNVDEFAPAANNFAQDNDQVVVVGAVCISKTLVPRREDGKADPALLTVEGLLAFNNNGMTYKSQQGAENNNL